MSKNRDLMDAQNVGEFAFTMCVIGVLLAIIAFAAAFFLLYWAGRTLPMFVISATGVIWLLLNIPVYRSLMKRAARWQGERRAGNQIIYVELCSVAFLAGISLLAGDVLGGRELILFLKYFFYFWILALLVYQVVAHAALRYRILPRDGIRWCCIGALTLLNLFMTK
jgi:hypothetical protein